MRHMKVSLWVSALGFATIVVGIASVQTRQSQDGTQRSRAAQAVSIDSDDIAGVVMGPTGPEAGVWVIAETAELATKFVKIVVTDDQGRYVMPDLPKATYKYGCAATGCLIPLPPWPRPARS